MKNVLFFDLTGRCSGSVVMAAFFLLAAVLMPNNAAWAANFTVANAADLQTALTTAQSNGQDDTIKLARGIYNGNFTYSSSQGKSIRLWGGYDAQFRSRSSDPKNTVLDGQGAGRVLSLTDSAGGSITVDGLTIKNGSGIDGAGIYARSDRTSGDIGEITLRKNIITGNNAVGNDYSGGGVYVYSKANNGTSANIIISDNIIRENTSDGYGGGVYAKTISSPAGNSGEITIVNNIVAGNTAASYDGGGMSVYSGVNDAGSTCGNVYICNNTFTGNTAGRNGGGFELSADNGFVRIYNNIVWNNAASGDGDDIHLVSLYGATLYGYYNNYTEMSGASWTQEVGNMDQDPLFKNPARGDYHIKPTSRCINAGRFAHRYWSTEIENWVNVNYTFIPETDFEGDSRDSEWVEVSTNMYYKFCDIGADEYKPTVAPIVSLLLLGCDTEADEYKPTVVPSTSLLLLAN